MADMYMKNIRDWRDATLMLSFEEKGYFEELLNLIYLYDGCLPDNDDLICRAMPVSKRLHKRLKNKLIEAGLIEIKDGHYFNNRASKELLKINNISTKNQLKAEKRWTKSLKNKETADATAMQKVNSEIKDIPKGISKKPPPKKGTRFEAEFKNNVGIPERYRAIAEEKGLHAERIEPEWERFKDHFTSADCTRPVKKDWPAAWRIWVGRAIGWQGNQSADKSGRSRDSICTTTEGARLALDRRRNRGREVRQRATANDTEGQGRILVSGSIAGESRT